MAAGNTYTRIATVSAGGTNTITFSSIPSTYTDLFISYAGAFSTNTGMSLHYNNDNGNNYSITSLGGNGTTAASARSSNVTAIYLNNYSGSAGQQSIQINVMNYANSTTYKTCLVRAGDATSATEASVGLWRNTAAITRIDVYALGQTFVSGSTCTLYGIAAA